MQSDLNEESIEFLIYYLKKFDDGTNFLEYLKYTNVNIFVKLSQSKKPSIFFLSMINLL